MSTINEIVESYLCYGCGTCNVVCSHQAITMRYDNIGRLLPVIDKKKCTNCGLCYNHCPSLDLTGIQLPDTEDKYVGHCEKVYTGKATEERIYRNSQSGGLVTATVKYLLETGRIDAAIMCRVDDAIEYTPKAVLITTPDELFSCQKSSYVPVDIVSALKQADQFNAMAVVGTGCHIQGVRALQNYNKKYKEKIKYIFGLICDRTLCKTATDVLFCNNFKDAPKRLVWRDKSINYKNARIIIKTTDNRTAHVPTWKRHALKDPFTNPRCRLCFDKLNTKADIVFGDPWGMSKVDWKGGTSVVICRSLTGLDVINGLLNDHRVELEEAPLSEVLTGQYIEQRKKNVSAALAYYQSKGWLMPSYSIHLFSSNEIPQLSSLINKFVDDSLKAKNDIIKQNLSYLKKASIRLSVNKIIRLPIRIIKKITG